MNPEENDALWKLLGKAERKPKISPAFSQNVAREARQLGKAGGGFWHNLFSSNAGGRWIGVRSATAACTFAILIAAAVIYFGGDQNPSAGGSPIVESVPPAPPESVIVADPVLVGFEIEMERLDQFDALLTVGDVDDLADEEIAMLLF